LQNLTSDFSNGIHFHQLLQVLFHDGPKKCFNPALFDIQKIENNLVALKFLEEKTDVKLVKEVRPQHIVEGKDETYVLHLIWRIIQTMQVTPVAVGEKNGKTVLLSWCRTNCSKFKANNFDTSWKSGMVLADLLHSYFPQSVNLDDLSQVLFFFF